MKQHQIRNMKHTNKVLILFITLFLLTQILGLSLITLGLNVHTQINEETQEETIEVIFADTTIGERPSIKGKETIIAITIGVIFGTILLLILSKYKKISIWKHWFFLASIITISISLGVLFNNYLIAWIIAIILSIWKVYKPNYIIHNLTELFIYPGIALLLVPLLNVFYAVILLILISLYDAYAVWKSKHMVTMAKFTKSANLFPGLAVSYNQKNGDLVSFQKAKNAELEKTSTQIKSEKENKTTKKETTKNKKNEEDNIRTGILGGGDVAFPLIFASTFLVSLLAQGYSVFASIGYSFIISASAGLALLLLFIYGKKDQYYPAMPFITAGCIAGYLIATILISIV